MDLPCRTTAANQYFAWPPASQNHCIYIIYIRLNPDPEVRLLERTSASLYHWPCVSINGMKDFYKPAKQSGKTTTKAPKPALVVFGTLRISLRRLRGFRNGLKRRRKGVTSHKECNLCSAGSLFAQRAFLKEMLRGQANGACLCFIVQQARSILWPLGTLLRLAPSQKTPSVIRLPASKLFVKELHVRTWSANRGSGTNPWNPCAPLYAAHLWDCQ